jgi:uncharacterized protein YndB with AHSA1/START domain
MTTNDTISLTVKKQFKQSPERVFDAWLDPDSARHWLFATETGEMVRADIDPRVGGGFNFVDRRDGEDIEHVGRYLEIDRPRRLVFSFSVPKYSSEPATVTIEIAADQGGAALTLTQEMDASLAEFKKQTVEGWTTILGELAARLESGR